MGEKKRKRKRKKGDSRRLSLAFNFSHLLFFYSRLTLVASILSGKLLVTPLMWHASMLCVRSFMALGGKREGKRERKMKISTLRSPMFFFDVL